MKYNGSDKWKQEATKKLNRIPENIIKDVKVNNESVVDEEGIANVTVPVYVSDLGDADQYVIKETLKDYYNKNETYSREEVNNLVDTIPKFAIEVVTILPTTQISTTTIYLIKTSETETGNLYTEYIYVNGNWEILGIQKLDLTNYYTKQEVDGLISGLRTETQEAVSNLNENIISHIGDSIKHITNTERTNWDLAKTHADSDHARTDATKVEKSTTNGNIKINGSETNVYTHPSGTNPHGTTKSDVGLGNVGNFKAVSTVASQGLTDTEKSNARTNIGAGTSSLGLGETSSTAYRGDRGKTAYDHSQTAHAPSNAQANVIETVKVNGTALTPSSKTVNIPVPSVGNGTITIKQSGTTKGTFTTNQSGDTTIELADSNTTYGVATSSSLGLVKSGADITVDSNGNVSVNDDSHNHVISNIDGLQTALDGKAPTSHGRHVPDACVTITDWNSATTNGWYMGCNIANQPIANGGWFYGMAIAHNNNYIRQIAWYFAVDNNISGTNCDRYERVKHNGTWGTWVNTTVKKAVPADAKFTDTWRGIQNNLTSDSTTDSLSAAQGKVLKGLIDGIEVGGRNLILNTGLTNGTNNLYWYQVIPTEHKDEIITDSATKSGKARKITYITAGMHGPFWGAGNLEGKTLNVGDTYSQRCMMKATSNVSIRWGYEGLPYMYANVTTEWQEFECTTTVTNAGTMSRGVSFYPLTNLPAGSVLYIADYKLEKGNIPTDWTAAPEDYLPTSGGVLTGEVIAPRFKTTNSKVNIWEDSEGGNIRIVSPQDIYYEMDAYDGNFRIYTMGTNNKYEGFSLKSNGQFECTGELVTTFPNALRAIYGNYGFMIRNDGYNTSFLFTNHGDPYGYWNNLRPIRINNANGDVHLADEKVKIEHSTGNIIAPRLIGKSDSLQGQSFEGALYVTNDTHILQLGYWNCSPNYDRATLLISSSFYEDQHGSGDIIHISQDSNQGATVRCSLARTKLHIKGTEREFYFKVDDTNKRVYLYVKVFGGNGYGKWSICPILFEGGTWVSEPKFNQPTTGLISISQNYASVSHTHDYLPLYGGTVTGQINKAGSSCAWVEGRNYAMLKMYSISGYSPFASIKTTNGSWEIGAYDSDGYYDSLLFTCIADSDYNASNNVPTAQIKFCSDGAVEGRARLIGSYTSDAGIRFVHGGLEIREANSVKNTQSDIGYAPSIGFHWANTSAGTLCLDKDGIFHFLKQDGTRATLDANINGNISGNAATATKLATARYIFGKSFNGTEDITGQAEVYGYYNSTVQSRFSSSGLKIRENGLVGSSQSDIGYAPSIGFFWNERVGSTLCLDKDGIFRFLKQGGTRATIDADINGNLNGSANALANICTNSSRPTTADIAHVTNGGVRHFKATSSMTTSKPSSDGHILDFCWDTSDAWNSQLFIANSTGVIGSRAYNASGKTWSGWRYAILSFSDSTYKKVEQLLMFNDSNNALITGDKGNFIWAVSSWSDRKLKKNIKDANVSALDKINQIQFKEFDFIDDKKFGKHQELGYIADELKEVFPECVVTVPQDKEKFGYEELDQVQDVGLIKYLAKSIQELSSIINEQNKKINTLQKEVDKLKRKN